MAKPATPRIDHKIKIKRGDTVQVIAGKAVGLTGKVLKVDRSYGKVIVEGVNMQTKHQKPNRANQTGGITRREAPLAISNVMYLHKGKPTRLGYKVEVTEEDGKRVVKKQRIAKSTGEVVD
ncbi:MAG: 50S ribosomal protein L24 [Defluviitaleaceae bacterium]|nr:50S ribosomal protein L24 [Defluviitaleaceae bacterium]